MGMTPKWADGPAPIHHALFLGCDQPDGIQEAHGEPIEAFTCDRHRLFEAIGIHRVPCSQAAFRSMFNPKRSDLNQLLVISEQYSPISDFPKGGVPQVCFFVFDLQLCRHIHQEPFHLIVKCENPLERCFGWELDSPVYGLWYSHIYIYSPRYWWAFFSPN